MSSQYHKRQEKEVQKTKVFQRAIRSKSHTGQEKFIYVEFQVNISKGNKIEIAAKGNNSY